MTSRDGIDSDRRVGEEFDLGRSKGTVTNRSTIIRILDFEAREKQYERSAQVKSVAPKVTQLKQLIVCYNELYLGQES